MTVKQVAELMMVYNTKERKTAEVMMGKIFEDMTQEERLLAAETIAAFYDKWAKMKKYQVNYLDPNTGAESAIDTITAPAGYTAFDYIWDCELNSSDEWIDMIHAGKVTLTEIE